MIRSLFLINRAVSSCCQQPISKINNVRKQISYQGYLTWKRNFSISSAVCKKRKSPEERAHENKGKRVIRYAPKAGADKVVGIWKNMTVQEVADVLNKDLDHVFETLNYADKTPNAKYKKDTIIQNQQVIRDVVKLSGYKFKIVASPTEELMEDGEDKDAYPMPPAPPEALKPRPPVVCVMGHVDHGKTTLLDALRDTSVVEQEFGGITQHIGAFSVRLKSGDTVTFLDTPGHAAFTSMRSRGAHATDIVVLVVAADDGVMEQTLESIRMAREARVPVLVAVNKIDKPNIDIDKTLRSLAAHGIIVESMGGDVQAIPVSALKKMNLDTLVEAITVQAQMMELKADPTGFVEGVVIEAEVQQLTGKQATVLVQRGTLRRGSILVAGHGWAKVRLLKGADGKPMNEAPPSTPVSVLGWKDLPSAGDVVLEVKTEKRANEVMKWRAKQRMKEKAESDLEVVQAKEAEHRSAYLAQVERRRSLGRYKLRPDGPRQKEIQENGHPALYIVIKGDVDGSVEAILDILDTYDENHNVKLELVHYGVGQVTPSDIEIAETFNAVIYTFNVECPISLRAEAKQKKINVKDHNIIYKLVDDVKEEINLRMPKKQEEEIIGEANVLQQFMITEGRRKVPVAGSRCVKGSLARYALYRVVRGHDVVFEGKLSSMKHLKDEVDTIKRDMECGLRFSDEAFLMEPGDTIICYKLVDIPNNTSWDPGF